MEPLHELTHESRLRIVEILTGTNKEGRLKSIPDYNAPKLEDIKIVGENLIFTAAILKSPDDVSGGFIEPSNDEVEMQMEGTMLTMYHSRFNMKFDGDFHNKDNSSCYRVDNDTVSFSFELWPNKLWF